ncbi:CHAP domain-containing protein [Homoserinibacter sp. YIM 151385]|uniref:CHAP domain-containing protein n=1 Tax=Homoserinibacter sp. YIM 151385 TaxID=2985506 RepID=UPI0022F0BEB5|nr:CHAP domain-containing protein [Homoserinibacter sp. YIM 151385]WBU37869.1 CHAP domain-containing protein [Homoserinibacter sp. YIM 151385]
MRASAASAPSAAEPTAASAAPLAPAVPVAPSAALHVAGVTAHEIEEELAAGGRGRAKRQSRAKRERRSAVAGAAAPSARVRSRGGIRQRLTAGGVMLLVGGLFASLALPAYAERDADAETAQRVGTAAVQGLEVDAEVATAKITRDGYKTKSAADMRQVYSTAARDQNLAAYAASGARAMGDDYPWPGELTSGQGGGLSPLRYYYRECVDFVAWRLNRDAGVTKAPWKWDWSTLTPGGGNASAWASAWQSKGWPTGKEPRVGAVAWFNYNHVAYVSGITGDGQVMLEEYNWQQSHAYHQRVVSPSEVPLYLYAPPG